MRIAHTIFACFFLLLGTQLLGQQLARRAFLGIVMEPLTGEMKADQKYDQDHGIFVPEVVPAGTFGKMGLSGELILQEINGNLISSREDVFVTMRNLREGDKIQVKVFADGKSGTHSGLLAGWPRENHSEAVVEYGEVTYPNNVLRSLLYLPSGVEKPPVVFYLQGYTCQSIEMQDQVPMKRLINDWINAGYAVYMVEKPGLGDSQSVIPCMDIDFQQELTAFSEAYKALWQEDKIDRDHIFLFGHSMGGVIAPFLSNQRAPKGVMVYGTVGKTWYEYMKDVYTEQEIMFGATEKEVEENKKENFAFLDDLMKSDLTNEEILAKDAYGSFLDEEGIRDDLARGYYIYRHYLFWRSLYNVNIPEAWSKVTTNVYVMHGEYDVQAIHPRYAKMIAENVNAHQGNAAFDLIPDTDHVFLKFDSMEENITALSNGTYGQMMATRYNPAVAAYSLNWMNKQVGRETE